MNCWFDMCCFVLIDVMICVLVLRQGVEIEKMLAEAKEEKLGQHTFTYTQQNTDGCYDIMIPDWFE